MNTTSAVRCEEVVLNTLSFAARAALLDRLAEFAEQHYCLKCREDFIQQVIKADKEGVLAIFSVQEQWVGFTRIYQQEVLVSGEAYTVFFGSSWYNQAFKLDHTAARFALVYTMRYKLFQPHKKMVYLATANTPQRYRYLHQLSTDCILEAAAPANPVMVNIVSAIAQTNGWALDKDNPLIIKQCFPLREYPLQKLDEDPCFTQLNPHYMKGHWLMVSIPLDMQTIGRCIRKNVGELAHIP